MDRGHFEASIETIRLSSTFGKDKMTVRQESEKKNEALKVMRCHPALKLKLIVFFQ